jgi:hypothetical protein
VETLVAPLPVPAHRMHPLWDEVLMALPILSQKNASEQPHCDPTVVGMDGRLHSGVRTHPCALDHQLGLQDGSDAQQVVTFETEPSLQPTLVAFSSRGRC